jgi:hypothetical protein
MKTVLKLLMGLVIVPITLIVIFTFINWVLSILFNEDYNSIQNSMIWCVWGLIILFSIIGYFVETQE